MHGQLTSDIAGDPETRTEEHTAGKDPNRDPMNVGFRRAHSRWNMWPVGMGIEAHMTNRLSALLLAIAIGGCSHVPPITPAQPANLPGATGSPSGSPGGDASTAQQADQKTAQAAPENPDAEPEKLSPVAEVAKVILLITLIAISILTYLPFAFVR